MRTIAVTNQKGGAAKTTTTVNLAAAFGEKGHRTLVIDLDPQASASAWLGAQESGPGAGLLEVFTDNGNLADLVRETTSPGVDLVPSSRTLGKAEPALAGEAGAQAILRDAIKKLPRDRWELVLIDCPPSLGLLSVSALVACREVLVPVTAHAMSLAGLAELQATLEKVRARMNREVAISAILACRTTRTILSRDVVESIRERFGPLLLKAAIRESIRLAEAPSRRQPITLYDANGTGAEDYRAAAAEVLTVGKGKRS